MRANVSPMGEAELVEKYLNNEYVFSNDGILVDSDQFNGLTSEEAKKKISISTALLAFVGLF